MKVDIDARAQLEAHIRLAGSQRELARRWGISQQYINQLLHGQRPFSEAILTKLGLRRTVVALPLDK